VKSGTGSVAGHLEVGLRDLLRVANVTNTRRVRRTREKIAEKKWKSRKKKKIIKLLKSLELLTVLSKVTEISEQIRKFIKRTPLKLRFNYGILKIHRWPATAKLKPKK
jgi:hypothetical protein